jgi:hypothetical protein
MRQLLICSLLALGACTSTSNSSARRAEVGPYIYSREELAYVASKNSQLCKIFVANIRTATRQDATHFLTANSAAWSEFASRVKESHD